MKERSALIGSIVAGLLASACCIGPLLLGVLGLGSAGFASAIAPLRPLFLALTATLLGVGFYFAYRPLQESNCGPDGSCAKAPNRRTQRIVLWTVAALALVLTTYPIWADSLRTGRGAIVPASSESNRYVLKIDGMTCSACEGEVEHELGRVPGVTAARVDYPSGRAEIQLATAGTDPAPLLAAVERAGYKAVLADASSSAQDMPKRAPLAGEWRGQLTVGEGRTSELVVDLALEGDRWVGQFDLKEFGVEDYPVEAALDGHKVKLYLTAAQIDFEGTVSASGDSLTGIATTNRNRDPLVLKRAGEARFSGGFLALEKTAEDSTRVEQLSADASELRRRFNEDRAYARLVMLLSPT